MTESRRAILTRLVQEWHDGNVDEQRVHEESEAMFKTLERTELPKDDAGSIEVEILGHLEILDHQHIVVADAPAILEFLDTPAGKELEAWRKWEAYLDGIDFGRRAEELKGHPYYVVPTREE